MIHNILVKFNDDVTDKEKIASQAQILFSELTANNKIHSVSVHLNCIDRSNRYDMLIAIDMDKDALDFYDESEPHKKWKKEYSCFIANKVIFDYEK